MASRTPEQIRASIEANRVELAHSLERLRGEVTEAGFILGGGIAGIVGLFRRR
jgi:heterodisulfide reductase subunit A-like polyferredoxin